MAPTQKKKHTRGRSNRRKNALDKRILLPNLVVCSNCKKLKQTHRACPYCGFYK